MSDYIETAADAAFRKEAYEWLEANGEPKRSDGRPAPADLARAKVWQAKLAEGRWAAPNWPSAYGGRDATGEQMRIWREELSGYENPTGPFAISIGFVGPTLIAHGNEEQKRYYLPRILSGTDIWCQLFSEPGAGSDLASLSTRAELIGDEWIVNGQKVWTSGAVGSDYAILITRTDPDATKHRGITYLVCPMHQAGIDIRPLRQITGEAHFNEVFLTDVRVPKENVVGEVNGGWAVTMTTFLYERSMIGGGGGGERTGFDGLLDLARAARRDRDPVVRQALADNYIRARILKFLGDRVQEAARAGKGMGPESSIMKLSHALQMKRTGELALGLEGAAGALARGDAPAGGSWQQSFLSAPSIRIAGGSDEIQRNIIGERVLGLPPEPRVDKDVPFRELLTGTRS
jgi:alkylation response protein AidB-like acyl-CoA dehydrogenase